MFDTIAAISTTKGIGAIAIIRVSGTNSISIVNTIFKGKNLNLVESHTINYGKIVDNNQVIDEVLVSVMKSPKTFTKEDVVEINTHGGIATTNKVLELLLLKGCRIAQPGEFTKRAFLNGRIDLVEAEGVMDLITSKTESARKLALNHLNGYTSNLIKLLRKQMIDIIANIEVNIDYPEYEDIEEYTIKKLNNDIKEIECKIKDILKKSNDSKVIKEGINVSIIGSPNVGKSSILNKLIEEEKAIVTDIAGTTRDIVEGTIILDDIILNIIDTAGIRKTEDIIENIGVKKSLELIEKSDLVLFILDNNSKISKSELNILDKLKDKNYIIIINKIDLDNKLDLTLFKNYIKVSALKDTGIEEIKEEIKRLYNLENLNLDDYTYLSSARDISLLKQALQSLEEVKIGLKNKISIDMIEIDLKKMWNILGEIIGESYTDELIDELFSKFCLGK